CRWHALTSVCGRRSNLGHSPNPFDEIDARCRMLGAHPPLEGEGRRALARRGGVIDMAKRTIDNFKRTTARRLRLNQTNAEERLWRKLRHWPMQGTHFRRQVPIGPYIADFACMAARLVIEVDGSQHGIGDKIVRDETRTRWLEAAGYRVVRFWNND